MMGLKGLSTRWKNRGQMGQKNVQLELAAFLPAALEIQETPPNPALRWLAFLLTTLVVSAITWACIGHMDIVATAEGKIIPSSRVKQIQPLQKSIVSDVLVQEGDYVSKGVPLVVLDSTLTLADKNRLSAEYQSVLMNKQVDAALLQALSSFIMQRNNEFVSVKSIKEVALSHFDENAQDDEASPSHIPLFANLLDQKLNQIWSQYQSMKSGADAISAEIKMSQAIILKLEQTLPIVEKRAAILEELLTHSYASEVDYLAAEQERIQIEQDLEAEKQRKKQLLANEAQSIEQINTHLAQVTSDLLTAITQYNQQLAVLSEEITKATDLNSRQTLYAPVSGRVQDLMINTVGGVVTDAQQLMLIVPDEEQLEVEVFIENKDIGFVHADMDAEVKVHTFPFTKYGVIDAKVFSVSNDAIVDETQGLIFRMQLTLAKNALWVDGKKIKLVPGMAVTAEMRTGKRRIIDYFLAPLLRAKDESIRER